MTNANYLGYGYRIESVTMIITIYVNDLIVVDDINDEIEHVKSLLRQIVAWEIWVLCTRK